LFGGRQNFLDRIILEDDRVGVDIDEEIPVDFGEGLDESVRRSSEESWDCEDLVQVLDTEVRSEDAFVVKESQGKAILSVVVLLVIKFLGGYFAEVEGFGVEFEVAEVREE
jgi:hypothetical protein